MLKVSNSIEVLFEHKDFIVINKPPCVHSVETEGGSPSAIVQFLKDSFPPSVQASPNSREAGLVNRLDYETSGVLLVALNRTTWELLREAFSIHEVQKHYKVVLPLGFREITAEGPAEIEGFLGSRGRHSKKVQFSPHERPRFLHSRSVFRHVTTNVLFTCCIAEVDTFTGRRHQVRAHAKALGAPLIGDTLYGSTRNLWKEGFLTFAKTKKLLHDEVMESILPQFFLHAERISFSYEGKIWNFSAPAPIWWQALLP